MSPAIRADEVGTVAEGPLSAVLAALARDDPGAVVAALDGQLHHGRPGSPAALRQQVGERLATALTPQTGRVTRWIDALATSPSPTGRQVACLLLASRYSEDPEGVLRTAELLAEDPHWEVREAAGGLLGTLLDRDFTKIRGRLEVRGLQCRGAVEASAAFNIDEQAAVRRERIGSGRRPAMQAKRRRRDRRTVGNR